MICIAIVLLSELSGFTLLKRAANGRDHSAVPGPPDPAAPSLVVWNRASIAEASDGNALRGLLIARRCEPCHGPEGFSPTPAVPNLAGIDPGYIWNQLEDFHSGKRRSLIMQRIVQPLSERDFSDLAAYFSLLPQTPDPQLNESFPEPMKDSSANSIARRMLSVGDPSRGIPPCQACHGPTGQTPVTPSLASQNSEYLLLQLDDFADGTRSNDINLPMRTISTEMSERERQAAAEFYGANLGRGAVGFQSPR